MALGGITVMRSGAFKFLFVALHAWQVKQFFFFPSQVFLGLFVLQSCNAISKTPRISRHPDGRSIRVGHAQVLWLLIWGRRGVPRGTICL